MTSRGTVLGIFAVLSVGILIGGAVQADPLFNPQVPHSVGDGPGSVAISDLDGDGNLDLAVANEISNDVSILLGSGGGAFGGAVTYSAGTEPSSVAVGLFDGDAALDLAVANRNSDDVSVFLSVGDGTFGTAVPYAAGASPSSVALGDLNEDGELDLAVSNYNDDEVSILLGNGDGTFQTAMGYEAGSEQTQLAVGLFNGDAHLDLAVANQFSSEVSVLLGNGDGTFQTAVAFSVGSFQLPSAVAVGHLNNDTYADLVVAGEFNGDVAVLLGNGDGTFQAAVTYDSGTAAFSVAIGDLDLDGDDDLAVADYDSEGLVWILLGNGDGTFSAAESYAAQSSASSVAIGDLDKAGTPDLAVANYGSDTVSVFLNTKETCTDEDGDGYGAPAHDSCAYPEEDCDDGNPDIHPGASELCNGLDDDCNGGSADGAGEAWMGTLCDGPDLDYCEEGTYGCEGAAKVCSDDTDDTVEVCDGVDNDCNGFLGDWETDDDSDHYVECVSWEGTDPGIYGGNDCDDSDAARSPGLVENVDYGNCEDGKDNDCDDLVDYAEPGCPEPGPCAPIPAS
jgi:hypothetical protein